MAVFRCRHATVCSFDLFWQLELNWIDLPVSILIEGAVRERQNMCFQCLIQREILELLWFDFLDEFYCDTHTHFILEISIERKIIRIRIDEIAWLVWMIRLDWDVFIIEFNSVCVCALAVLVLTFDEGFDLWFLTRSDHGFFKHDLIHQLIDIDSRVEVRKKKFRNRGECDLFKIMITLKKGLGDRWTSIPSHHLIFGTREWYLEDSIGAGIA